MDTLDNLLNRVETEIENNRSVLETVRNDAARRNGRQAHMTLHGEPKD